MKAILSISLLIATLLLSTQCKKNDVMSGRCHLIPDAGECFAAIPKYYYDKEEKKCKQFIWGGCGGVVPFETMAECEQQCDCN